MRIKFKTESGTWYEVDSTHMSWVRLERGPTSGPTRGEGGKLIRWPEIRVGEPAMLWDTDVLPGCVAHAVQTSRVVEIVEGEGGE